MTKATNTIAALQENLAAVGFFVRMNRVAIEQSLDATTSRIYAPGFRGTCLDFQEAFIGRSGQQPRLEQATLTFPTLISAKIDCQHLVIATRRSLGVMRNICEYSMASSAN